MNERIRQLAEQSGCKVMDGEWYIPSATGLEKIVYTKGIGLEKFAELIVRECVEQLHITDVTEDFDKGVTWSIKQIQKHFGVKS